MIITLAYLAVQVRHSKALLEESNRVAILEARSQGYEELGRLRRLRGESSEVARIWRLGCEGTVMEIDDRHRFEILVEEYLKGHSNAFQRHELGLWDNSTTMQQLAKELLENPGLLELWNSNVPPTPFRDAIEAEMEASRPEVDRNT